MSWCAFSVSFLLVVSLTFPLASQATLRPISDEINVSWSPEPPSMFTICWDKCKARMIDTSIPWYGPWFKMKLCPYEDEVAPLIAESKATIVLWPPDSPYFADQTFGPFAYCDWDGLACHHYDKMPAKTFYGCIGVENVKSTVLKVDGDVDVTTPLGYGGAGWNTKGAPFIKIYFPELVTATLEEWSGDIVAGQCADVENYETCPCVNERCSSFRGTCSRIEPSKSYGHIAISGLTVKIHSGGWTQISVHKGEIDLSKFKRWVSD